MNGKTVDLFRICADMHDRQMALFVLLPNDIIVIQHCFVIYDACHLFLHIIIHYSRVRGFSNEEESSYKRSYANFIFNVIIE